MLDAFESHDSREFSKEMMGRECQNMLMEVQRLKDALQMQDKRLKNILKFVDLFSYRSESTLIFHNSCSTLAALLNSKTWQ